jgi:hypothetical protein
VWELAVEHREVFSLNDTVVTAVGGVALGEPMFQLGEFFARSAPTWRNRILAGIFSPARAVASLDPDDRPRRAAVTDRYGFADDVHHRFELALGGSVTPGAAARGSGRGAARLDLELVNVRSWGRAGRAATRLRGGESTRLLVDYVGTSGDLEALTLFTKTSLLGVHRQDVRATGSDGLSGVGAILAASSAFDLSFDDAGAFTDFLTAVHVLGPSADVALHRGRFALRLGADVYGDFAMVRPFALGAGEEARAAVAGHKSPLRKQEYYYALGLTAAARVEARYRRARLGGSLEWNGYDSIEGLDRHQHAYTSPAGVHHAAIANDSSITDVRTRVRLFADAPLPATPFSLGLGLDLERRSGRLGEAARAAEEARLKLLLACAL